MMTIDQLISNQEVERNKYLRRILESSAEKKLIIAGPGTGKTFTMGEVLKLKPGGNNIALTFIRKLVADMESKLSGIAEVKTFHAFCKMVLHQKFGKADMIPFLTKIIEKDAELLQRKLSDFDSKFQSLDESTGEIEFYLYRGDYYEAVSFNDSVFRLYKVILQDENILPKFDQIVVDEYQDFNLLETSFIEELEKRGPILIVGDDDQAIYDGRCASPNYLRKIANNDRYEKFELPFCSRSTQVIVEAAKAVLESAVNKGYLVGRLTKPYECFIKDKLADNEKYPKIIIAECSKADVVPKYLLKEIQDIDKVDIQESYKEGEEYPTVLIVGPRHYLKEAEKQLKEYFPQVEYTPSVETEYGICDAYNLLLLNRDSNLGWRILIDIFIEYEERQEIIVETENNVPLVNLLSPDFIKEHLSVIDIIDQIRKGTDIQQDQIDDIKLIVGDYVNEIIEYFLPKKEEAKKEIDISTPKILLTSFKGCKGLSAGHVFMVGANNGSLPKNVNNISDTEISDFIVALTRAKKQCHIISNRWLFSPKDKSGNWIPAYDRSEFVSWMPIELVNNLGYLTAKDLS